MDQLELTICHRSDGLITDVLGDELAEYYPFDFRRLINQSVDGCEFFLHEQSKEISSEKSVPKFQCQEDYDVSGLTGIFTSSYQAPIVYSATVKNCIVGPRSPSMPRYWPFFFNDRYAFNFLSAASKVDMAKSGYFSIDNDVVNVDLESKDKIHISGLSVWFYTFDNIDHLFRECLPGLLALDEMGVAYKSVKFITPLISDDLVAFLQALGVPRDNILQFDNKWLSFEKLIIPCFGSFGHLHTPSSYYKKTSDMIRERVLAKGGSKYKSKNIYVSRRKARMRRVLNEDVIVPELEKRNFTIVDPGELSKVEQIKLFSCAENIVGPHGMGVANCIVSQNPNSLIEIMSTTLNKVSYFRSAQLSDMSYGCYYTVPLDLRFSLPSDPFGDVVLDKVKLMGFIDKFI